MNERLRSALAQRSVSPESLAEACEVDPKTVGRWLGGRVPHPRHRFRAAQHLRVEETFLWPRPQPRAGRSSEDGCEVRLHETTLYNSLFRYDDDLLVNPHIFGQPASANPVFYLRRAGASGWFDSYTESFEVVWADARPWEPGLEGGPCDGQN